MEFDVDSFIAGINSDSSQKTAQEGGRLRKLMMNSRDNQGTVTFIPIMSKSTLLY